jgi:hypothetical protein
MSKIKEHYHEEISRGLHGGDEDYRYEEWQRERESVRATLVRKGGEPRRIGEIIAEMYPDPGVEAQISRWEEHQIAKRESGLPSWVAEMYG